jgi:hypothetical protein
MGIFYVIDENFTKYLVEKGARLIGKKEDINGRAVWIFDQSSITFDINSDEFKKKTNFPKTTGMKF